MLLLIALMTPFDGFQLVLPPTLDDCHHRHIRLWFLFLSMLAFAALELKTDDIRFTFCINPVTSRTGSVDVVAAALTAHRMTAEERHGLLQQPTAFGTIQFLVSIPFVSIQCTSRPQGSTRF
jgi:hypothetical protein